MAHSLDRRRVDIPDRVDLTRGRAAVRTEDAAGPADGPRENCVHPRHLGLLPRLAPPRWCATARSSPPRRKSASRARSTTRRFPRTRSSTACAEAGIALGDLDYVGFYDKPLLKFERLLETYLAYAPRGFASFLQGDAAVAQAEAVPAARACDASSAARYKRPLRLHRASRVARGERVLPVAVRGGRDPHASTASASGRRRAIGVGRGNTHRAAAASCASRTRSGCSTRRSPTSPASRSTAASTS